MDSPAATPNLPLPHTWWAVPGRWLCGPFPGDRDPNHAALRIGTLLDAGIRAFINLQDEDETNADGQYFLPYRNLARRLAKERELGELFYLRCPVRDMDVPDARMMAWLLDQINALLAAEHPIYLHCWGGHGRTGTAVGCWLMEHLDDKRQVFQELKRMRQHDPYLGTFRCPQTQDQERFVRRWVRP
jgi:hypothetical protein